MPSSPHRPAVIALAGWLRETREQHGVSLRRLAGLAEMSPSALSGMELGRRPSESAAVAHLLGILGVRRNVREHLVDLARRSDCCDLIDHNRREDSFLRVAYEERATRVLEWSPSLIPEMLQTFDYAHALQEASPIASDGDDERQVTRTLRQGAVSYETGTQFTFLVGETATRPDFCTENVLHAQVGHVAAVAQRATVTVHSVPVTACPPGLVEPFTLYLCGKEAIAVAIQHHQSTVFLTSEAGLANYAKTARSLQRLASGIA